MELLDKIRMNFIIVLLELNNVLYIELILLEFMEWFNECWKLYYRMFYYFRILDNIEVYEWVGLYVIVLGFCCWLLFVLFCFILWFLMVYFCMVWLNLFIFLCYFWLIGIVCILFIWNMIGFYGSVKSYICFKFYYFLLF